MQARQLQRRQTYKSRGTRQRMIAARQTVNSIVKRAIAPQISTNVGRNAFMKAAYGVHAKETGYVDTATASYELSTTGSVTLLNTVAQGASVNQRVGKKIVMKGLQCRGILVNRSTALLNDVAYMIVYDKRPTGALPLITDILNAIDPKAMNNDANAGRFRILKRHDDVLIGNSSQTVPPVSDGNLTEATQKNADFYLDLKGLGVTYKAAGTGAIGDIEEGALYLITVGSSATGTTAANLSCGFRLRFVDV